MRTSLFLAITAVSAVAVSLAVALVVSSAPQTLARLDFAGLVGAAATTAAAVAH